MGGQRYLSILMSIFTSLLLVSIHTVSAASINHNQSVKSNNNQNNISCYEVRQVFVLKKVGPSSAISSHPVDGKELTLCGSEKSCCSKEAELLYKRATTKDARDMLHGTFSYLRSLLTTSLIKFNDKFIEMIKASENSTLTMFADTYPDIAVKIISPTNHMYGSILKFINGYESEVSQTMNQYFDDLFPLVYHNLIQTKPKELNANYANCLRSSQQDLMPFGDISQQLIFQLEKSLDAAKTLLNAISMGIEVVNRTQYYDIPDTCLSSLTKLTYCAHCQGHVHIKPCSGFCLNVLRGCLSKLADLDKPWNEYLMAMERFSSGIIGPYNLENVLAAFNSKISEAVSYSISHGNELTKRAKVACGLPKRYSRDISSSSTSSAEPVLSSSSSPSSFTSQSSNNESVGRIQRESVSSSRGTIPSTSPLLGPSTSSLYIRIQSFSHQLIRSKGMYTNLADSLCSDENLSTQREVGCWNGHSIGEYTKMIAGIGSNDQGMNPEVQLNSKDLYILSLIEKIQRMKDILNSKVLVIPQSDSFLFDEDSGSGIWRYNSITDDEDYNEDDLEGSGSGDSFDEPSLGHGSHSEKGTDITFSTPTEDPDKKIGTPGSGVFRFNHPSFQVSLFMSAATWYLSCS